ncbi:MAG: CpsD/CapB family tyrosine-protein kinase [Lachnospiraceae bacterium]|nr:CpsD/CapB family tyrosine-protein kinase [Lachnospiraceae bacterium]
MQEENRVQAQPQSQPGYNGSAIDLIELAENYLRMLKRFWLQVLLLLLIFAVTAVTWYNHTYMPNYTAKVTYSVNKTGDVGTDSAIGQRLSEAITTLTATRDFREDLLAAIDEDTLNLNYSFSSDYTESANLFTVSVTSNNYQNSNLLMTLFQEVYPEWASMSVSTVELQLVDLSSASDTPVNAYSPVRSGLTGALAALFVCIAAATVFILTTQKVRKESDMKKVTTKSCISQIPEVKAKKRSESARSPLLLVNKHINWGLKQSVRAAQSRIERLMEEEEQKVLLITSTLPQEGKSVISVNLALAFAEKGKKVMLLDGDLRNPSVLKVLGLGEHAGLTDYLEKGTPLRELIVSQDGVDVISGGFGQRTVSEMEDAKKITPLMTWLRMTYDYILIDTPPSYSFTDAEILSKYADAVVYVVRHDMPTVREVKEGMSAFIENRKLIGYLINRNPDGYSTYGKYGKYGYGKYGRYGRYGAYGYGHYGKYMQSIETAEEEAAAAQNTNADPAADAMNTEETL